VNQTAQKIAEAIAGQGAISFARFMELALYCPVCGYYETEDDTIGRRGDYYTSVSVGSLFGELLGFQFAEWMGGGVGRAEGGGAETGARQREPIPEAGRMSEVIEAGAHGGQLARDILEWFRRRRSALFEGLQYWIVEPSGRRQEWQRRNLGEFGAKVRWVKGLGEIDSQTGGSDPRDLAPGSGGGGFRILFCNELLDAMPAHRLGWDASRQAWFEWGVTVSGGRFAWTRLEQRESTSADLSRFVSRFTSQAPPGLPDGFTVEVCPAAADWWGQAAGVVKRGVLMAVDYGLTAEELWVPERAHGTLRGYSGHRLSADPLASPGEQDLTSHVNFSVIREAGEAGGAQTEGLMTQEKFLTNIAARIWTGEEGFGEWTRERTRQFQTLTHPEHLGRAFRVLVQSRG